VFTSFPFLSTPQSTLLVVEAKLNSTPQTQFQVVSLPDLGTSGQNEEVIELNA
jgi:hypothetical protein